MNRADVLILGGSMAGLCAGIAAGRQGASVTILEKFDQVGKKLLATGNGRCNLMNRGELRYFRDADFARKVMGENHLRELTEFWESLGLRIRYDQEGRGYPCTFMASTVVDCLKAELKRVGVKVETGRRVSSIQQSEHGANPEYSRFLVRTEEGESWSCSRLILATGGAAQPKLGGNTDGFGWLERMGHHLIPPAPALTPILTDSRSISGLAGLRVKCRISVIRDGTCLHAENGELLFTEHGISGICVMQCARYVEPGRTECRIDLVPDLYENTDDLANELAERQRIWPEENPTELLRGLLAPKMSYAVCKQAGLALRGEKNGSLTAAQLRSIAETAKGYRILAIGIEGFDRAQVMAGGVDCREINPQNMESRIVPGLYIVGELVNVDGDCGGYNLMFAAMSGIRAGKEIRERMDLRL